MRAIVAADEKWGIGKGNALLVSIPQDMKFFRNETMGKTVIMGRKTLESFPNKSPLPGRNNIILSGNPSYKVKGAHVVNSVEQALEAVKECDPDDVYVIGGESVYRQFLPYCSLVFVTRIHFTYASDCHFPDLDRADDWILAGSSEEQIYFDLEYEFDRYVRKEE